MPPPPAGLEPAAPDELGVPPVPAWAALPPVGGLLVPAADVPADEPEAPLVPPGVGPGGAGSELQARTVERPASVAQPVRGTALT